MSQRERRSLRRRWFLGGRLCTKVGDGTTAFLVERPSLKLRRLLVTEYGLSKFKLVKLDVLMVRVIPDGSAVLETTASSRVVAMALCDSVDGI